MAENSNRIAIIGGGVSGLAVAYHLITRKDPIEGLEVVIFERTETLGGNADTVEVELGKNYAQPGHPKFLRWADHGVNDFNKTSYQKMFEAMERIKFHDFKPLEDTVCFYTLDGSVLYTVDDYFNTDEDKSRFKPTIRKNYPIVDERFHMRQCLADANRCFMEEAAQRIIDDRNREPKLYRNKTVAEYVAEYIEEETRKAENEEKKKDKEALIKEMAENILYPRIAAMYFVDERGPQTMPIVAVMEYYILQEGYGPQEGHGRKKEAERMYFDGGSQKWINCLHKWLEGEGRAPADEDLPKVTTAYNYAAKVIAGDEGTYEVYHAGKRGSAGQTDFEPFDRVVFACHADDALRSFGPEGLTEEIAFILGKVSYTNSIAVCHTYTGVMPPNRDTWRTYNVLIRKGTATTPYSMTYVINRHQNDAENPDFQEAGLPQYFVTLNPVIRIPDEFVLTMPEEFAVERAKRAPGYLKTWSKRFGETVDAPRPDHRKAIGWFRHNVLDFACLEAQELLKDYHSHDPGNVFFTGGWTNGAGLHEQCWKQGKCVVKKMYPSENRMEPSPS